MPSLLGMRWVPILHPRTARNQPYATVIHGTYTEPVPSQIMFMEEPLGVPASHGFGYYQGRPGDVLGPSGRFLLKAKLGYSMGFSVWIARDRSRNHHVALKILTGRHTHLNQEGKLQELKALQRLSSPPEPYSPYCIRLLEHFYEPGIDVSDGEHLCMVTELTACNLESILQSNPETLLTIPLVKRILRHFLLGLADIHSHGIAHTDLNLDNIMIDLGSSWTNASIDSWLKDNPPQVYPPTQSITRMVTGHVSQSLPQPSLNMLASHTFKLGDFGNGAYTGNPCVSLGLDMTIDLAQIVSDQTTDNITPLALRPPEIILGGAWNESVDIWTFGCLAFHIITRKDLFKPSAAAGQSEEDAILYQMICFCGEFFDENLLQRWPRSAQYFDSDCTPKPAENKKFFRKTFQRCILDCRAAISPNDVEGVAALMTKCLRLDPHNRATAQELLKDPWLAS